MSPATSSSVSAIHEAECVLGGVKRGPPISEADAVARRKAGLDIVVCGDDTMHNCNIAKRIEIQAHGPKSKHGGPHEEAGLNALPHWQPPTRPPRGHSFYETCSPIRKALLP